MRFLSAASVLAVLTNLVVGDVMYLQTNEDTPKTVNVDEAGIVSFDDTVNLMDGTLFEFIDNQLVLADDNNVILTVLSPDNIIGTTSDSSQVSGSWTINEERIVFYSSALYMCSDESLVFITTSDTGDCTMISFKQTIFPIPPEDETDPVVPPEDETDPVVPPEDETDPVVPPGDETDPVVPPEDETDPVVPPEDETDPVVPPGDETDPVVPPEESDDVEPPISSSEDSETISPITTYSTEESEEPEETEEPEEPEEPETIDPVSTSSTSDETVSPILISDVSSSTTDDVDDESSTAEVTSSTGFTETPTGSELPIPLPTDVVDPEKPFELLTRWDNIIIPFGSNGTHITVLNGDAIIFELEDGYLRVSESYVRVSDDGLLVLSNRESATAGWSFEENVLSFETLQSRYTFSKRADAEFSLCDAEIGYVVYLDGGCYPIEVAAANTEEDVPSQSEQPGDEEETGAPSPVDPSESTEPNVSDNDASASEGAEQTEGVSPNTDASLTSEEISDYSVILATTTVDTVITITDCGDDNVCTERVVTTESEVVNSSTINNILTTYPTEVTVTITSCEEEVCSEHLTIRRTIITTYCPVSSTIQTQVLPVVTDVTVTVTNCDGFVCDETTVMESTTYLTTTVTTYLVVEEEKPFGQPDFEGKPDNGPATIAGPVQELQKPDVNDDKTVDIPSELQNGAGKAILNTSMLTSILMLVSFLL